MRGTGGAALGLKALALNAGVDFRHERHHLGEIWNGKDTAEFFPPSRWFYLNNPRESGEAVQSLRLQIVSKWMAFDQIADVNSKDRQRRIDLYFDKGGKYKEDEVVMRARMLQQLEASIMLVTQDLRELFQEVYKIDLT